jgi:hypothetical protein
VGSTTPGTTVQHGPPRIMCGLFFHGISIRIPSVSSVRIRISTVRIDASNVVQNSCIIVVEIIFPK